MTDVTVCVLLHMIIAAAIVVPVEDAVDEALPVPSCGAEKGRATTSQGPSVAGVERRERARGRLQRVHRRGLDAAVRQKSRAP